MAVWKLNVAGILACLLVSLSGLSGTSGARLVSVSATSDATEGVVARFVELRFKACSALAILEGKVVKAGENGYPCPKNGPISKTVRDIGCCQDVDELQNAVRDLIEGSKASKGTKGCSCPEVVDSEAASSTASADPRRKGADRGSRVAVDEDDQYFRQACQTCKWWVKNRDPYCATP